MDQQIEFKNGHLVVPDQPVITFIEGDGTGADIWSASVKVLDAAVSDHNRALVGRNPGRLKARRARRGVAGPVHRRCLALWGRYRSRRKSPAH